ncbi:flagellar biosynthesis anti-sigma factor FlgM, partial [Pseudomonas aeruginosa]
VDMAKVNAMRAAIANGSFKVDASAIADKLLTNTVELLGAKGA